MQSEREKKKSTLSKRDSRGGRSGLVEGEGTAVLEDEAVRQPWKIGLRAKRKRTAQPTPSHFKASRWTP